MASTLVAIFENITLATGTDNPQDIWSSADDGATWTEGTPLVVGDGAFGQAHIASKSFVDVDRNIYYPDGGPISFTGLPYDYMVLSRSADLGVTWAPNLAPPDFDATNFFDVWTTHAFAQVSDLHLIAVGLYFADSIGDDRHILKSIDGGATWTVDTTQFIVSTAPTEPVVAWSCCVTTEGTILIGVRCQLTGANDPRIFRSTNSGTSYTEITLPTADKKSGSEWIVYTFCDLGDGVILCGGKFPLTGFAAPERYPPRVWRSTDDGASWTEVTSGVGTITYNASDTFHAVADIVKVDTNVVVLAMMANPGAVGGITNWRMSTDNGLTFPIVGSYTPTPGGNTSNIIGQMVVAQDGGVLATRASTLSTYEIWRGIIDDPPTTIAWERVQEVPAISGTDCGVIGIVRVDEDEPPPGPEPAPPGTPCPDEGGNFFPTADAALIEFGEVEIGDTSEADLIVTNHTLEVLLGTIDIEAPFASDPTTLGVSGAATQTLSITFTPTEPGDFMTVMVIQTGAGNVRVVLTGTGVEP